MESKCWQVIFQSEDENEALSEFLDDFFDVTAINYLDGGIIEYVGYANINNFSEKQMLDSAAAQNLKLPRYKIIELKSENWLKDYVIKFDAFEVADFCIYGAHQNEPPLSDKINLQVYAATAFGSNHQTTRACITAMSDLYHPGFLPEKILDMGCGSGILSLCAAKLWAKAKVIAADIDEEAVVVTLNNAQNNNLVDRISAFVGDGYNNDKVKSERPYNLILSNILANPLKEFAPYLAQHLSSQGYAVLSGFVDNQTEEVVASHTAQGLKLIKIYSIDNWRAALLQKE